MDISTKINNENIRRTLQVLIDNVYNTEERED